MSSTDLPAQPRAESEPFGQTGVFQFVWPAIASASLLLMGFSLYMWYRSHQTIDLFTSEKPNSSWYVSSIYGRILVTAELRGEPMEELDGNWIYSSRPFNRTGTRDGWQDSLWKRIGIEWRRQPLPIRGFSSSGTRGFWLRVRWPFIAALSAILPVVRVVHVWRKRRLYAAMVANACPECGYDLRASHKYCPECGRPVPKPAPINGA
jgi:hypothetical protein